MGLTLGATDNTDDLRCYTITREVVVSKLNPRVGDMLVAQVDTSGLGADQAAMYMRDIQGELQKVVRDGVKVLVLPKTISLKVISVVDLVGLLEDADARPSEEAGVQGT